MGCCNIGYECCMDCGNYTTIGRPIYGCALEGTCKCKPSNSKCKPIDRVILINRNLGFDNDSCCSNEKQCGDVCCEDDEFCCLGVCEKQTEDKFSCCEYRLSPVLDPVGKTCPQEQPFCCSGGKIKKLNEKEYFHLSNNVI